MPMFKKNCSENNENVLDFGASNYDSEAGKKPSDLLELSQSGRHETEQEINDRKQGPVSTQFMHVCVVSPVTYDKNVFLDFLLRDNENSDKTDPVEDSLLTTSIDPHAFETDVNKFSVKWQGTSYVFHNCPGVLDSDAYEPEKTVALIERYVKTNLRSTACSKSSPAHRFVLLLIFKHPIRWTPQDKDFMGYMVRIFGRHTLESRTLVLISNHKERTEQFSEYIHRVMTDPQFNTRFNVIRRTINELGDFYHLVTTQRIQSAEKIINDRCMHKFYTLLNDLAAKKGIQMKWYFSPILFVGVALVSVASVYTAYSVMRHRVQEHEPMMDADLISSTPVNPWVS